MKQTKVTTKLMAGCRKVFATRGINVGVDELVRLSDVSKMGLYQNFPSRAFLVEAVIRAITEDCLSQIQEAADSAGKGASKRLAAGVRCLCRIAAGGTDSHYEALSLIQAGLPLPTDVNHQQANAAKTKIADAIEALVREVPLGNSKKLVEEIMIITDGVTLRGLHHDRQEAELSGQRMLDALLKA